MGDETQEQTTARIVAEAATATAKAVFEAAQAAAVIVAQENHTALTAIAVLQKEVEILKAQQTSFECEMNRKMDNLAPKFEKIFDKLDEITQGRPTWAVTIIIGALLSFCVGLFTYIAK